MNEKLQEMLDFFLNEYLKQIILSNPVQKDVILKVKIRPVQLHGRLVFQAEEFIGKQAFHKNLNQDEAVSYIAGRLEDSFRQAEILSGLGTGMVLVSKKGTMTVKMKKNSGLSDPEDNRFEGSRLQMAEQMKILPDPAALSHNRQKRYVLQEGIPVPFLMDLGVMTAEGKIVRTRYDKFRQINRFLEFIEDILPKLDKSRETTIIDFGCGKSYLTFAMYYYLHELKGYPIRVIGLDLKLDVIHRCNQLAERYAYENLRFYHGDIATYDGVDHVDMVVTLHACDTATDYALEKAVRWGAGVILSVPCCQHEWNRQMKNEMLQPVLQYGLIRERMAALYTDALRAEILENQGYRTQILEFIDMEHTPKNILIRAVKEGKPKNNRREIEEIMEFLHVEPTLYDLLMKE
ncbi:MAG: class I SAM-dependent methyltransferase [Brotaphodocola sp.]